MANNRNFYFIWLKNNENYRLNTTRFAAIFWRYADYNNQWSWEITPEEMHNLKLAITFLQPNGWEHGYRQHQAAMIVVKDMRIMETYIGTFFTKPGYNFRF